MKTLLLATALLASPLAASAGTVTYVFRAFVEHSPNGAATRPANYGTIIPLRVTVNTDAPGSVSGNSEIYNGSGADDPIVSTQIGNATIGQSSYDSLIITKNPDGSSAITIQSYAVQVGSYTISFVSARGNAVASLNIPARILTLHFDTSSYASNYPKANVGGDLVTAGVPASSSAQ